MRRQVLFVGVISAVGLFIGCGGGESAGATVSYASGHPINWTSVDPTELAQEDEVLTLVNNHRIAMGLNVLLSDATMRDCARGHSRHMRGDNHGFFDHVNPEGDAPWDRMTKCGVAWSAVGENIAAGYPDATSVFNTWMNSSGHRANIEGAGWGRTGVGYQPGGGSGFSTYWTQVFAD